MSAKHLRILGIVATDRTFEATSLDGRRVWVGKCIHCSAKLVIRDDGRPLGAATIEHIWPQSQGGGNDLANLALACDRCNRAKGIHHDHKRKDDPKLREIVETLRRRRADRWRDPDEVGLAGRLSALSQDADEDDNTSASNSRTAPDRAPRSGAKAARGKRAR